MRRSRTNAQSLLAPAVSHRRVVGSPDAAPQYPAPSRAQRSTPRAQTPDQRRRLPPTRRRHPTLNFEGPGRTSGNAFSGQRGRLHTLTAGSSGEVTPGPDHNATPTRPHRARPRPRTSPLTQRGFAPALLRGPFRSAADVHATLSSGGMNRAWNIPRPFSVRVVNSKSPSARKFLDSKHGRIDT
jgi:hypothetical protein